MSLLEFLKRAKGDYTPMDENAKIKLVYKRKYETSSLGKDVVLTSAAIFHNDNKDYIYSLSRALISRTLTEVNERKNEDLVNEFMVKWDKKGKYFVDFQSPFVFEKVKITIERFLRFNPDFLTYDLTEDGSAFFQFSLNGKNIYCEIFFTMELKECLEAIINIYRNGKVIYAYGGNLEDAFEKVRINLLEKKISTCSTQYSHGISFTTFTTATV